MSVEYDSNIEATYCGTVRVADACFQVFDPWKNDQRLKNLNSQQKPVKPVMTCRFPGIFTIIETFSLSHATLKAGWSHAPLCNANLIQRAKHFRQSNNPFNSLPQTLYRAILLKWDRLSHWSWFKMTQPPRNEEQQPSCVFSTQPSQYIPLLSEDLF